MKIAKRGSGMRSLKTWEWKCVSFGLRSVNVETSLFILCLRDDTAGKKQKQQQGLKVD